MTDSALTWLFASDTGNGGSDGEGYLRARLQVLQGMEGAESSDKPSEPVTDSYAELVTRVRAGERNAFDELYLTFYPSLVTFAYHYVDNRAESEDIVQETFLAVWRARERWTVKASVREYLFGAVRNRALKYLRHEKVTAFAATKAKEDVAGVATSTQPTDAFTINSELRAALEEALAAMPAERRQVLSLRWNEQMEYPEIARILGISTDAAKQQGSRAQRALRELLEKFRG